MFPILRPLQRLQKIHQSPNSFPSPLRRRKQSGTSLSKRPITWPRGVNGERKGKGQREPEIERKGAGQRETVIEPEE